MNSTPRLVRSVLVGNLVLLAFILAQAMDGVLTYVGVTTHGLLLEGNPLIGWYMSIFGPEVALLGAKIMAVACAATLHWRAMHGTLVALTLFYLVGAILPWTSILWL